MELWHHEFSPERFLRFSLNRLNGESLFSIVVWRLPDGVPFDRVNVRKYSQFYIQAAGTAARLTVEVRVMGASGPLQQVVGRVGPERAADAAPTEVVPWSNFEQHVFSNEVFDADEAADLFVDYMVADAPAPTWSLRTLTL